MSPSPAVGSYKPHSSDAIKEHSAKYLVRDSPETPLDASKDRNSNIYISMKNGKNMESLAFDAGRRCFARPWLRHHKILPKTNYELFDRD